MVDEVDRIVGLSGLLEEGIGQVKQRDRGVTGAQTLVAMAAAQLTGQDHLVGLDRRRGDAAGQPLGPAVDVPSTTAAQIAKRFTDSAFWGIEEAVGRACARVLDRLAPVRRAELLRSVTLDGDVNHHRRRASRLKRDNVRVAQPSVGDRIEYIAAPVFDRLIETGDIGVIQRFHDGWVHAVWPRGSYSVPVTNVRPARRG